jgi:predicted RNase H-like HicB family nuclease
MSKYEVIIRWSEEDQAFLAEVPELPGCSAHGDTHENALINAMEAAELWLDTVKQAGRTFPAPRDRRHSLT